MKIFEKARDMLQPALLTEQGQQNGEAEELDRRSYPDNRPSASCSTTHSRPLVKRHKPGGNLMFYSTLGEDMPDRSEQFQRSDLECFWE
nr:PREDICTED: uncharacterized protein LOC104150091 isoform X2 [Struthio camelus australis]